MHRVNQEKLDDFRQWASLSFGHFQNIRYADALSNIRKSGEAACKIILTFYKSKSDFSRRSLKELLALVEKDNIIPKKILNCLQTFQLYGNAASHDNNITAKEAAYGIEALKIITDWIYIELLKEPVPFALNKYLLSKDDTESKQLKTAVKLLNEELFDAKKTTQKLEEKLNNADASKIEKNKLNNELKEASLLIKQLEETIFRNKKEGEINSQNELIDKEKFSENAKIEIPKVKKIRGNIFLYCLLLIGVLSAIYYFISTKKNNEKPLVASESIATDSSLIKVLILPFKIMQDNPNVDFKIETLISEKISVDPQTGEPILKIIYNPNVDKSPNSYEQANIINKGYNADVILFGEVIENADGSGYKLNLFFNFDSENPDNNYTGSLPWQEVKSLDNNTLNELLNEIICIVQLRQAIKYFDQNKFQEAIVSASLIQSKNKDLKIFAGFLQFNSNLYLGDIDRAREIATNLYKSEPEDMHVMLSYAYSITLKNDHLEEAEKIYGEAIKKYPKNAEVILAYANTLFNFNKIEEAKKWYEILLMSDSNNSQAYYRLGVIANDVENQPGLAKNYFVKSLEKDENFSPSLKALSQLFFILGDFENSLLYARKYMVQIKNDEEIYSIVSQIFQSSKLNNIDSSQKYLELSKKYNKVANITAIIAEGNLAYQNKNFAKAKTLYQKAYMLDSSINTTDPLLNLVDIYMVEKNIPSAEKLLLHYHQLDTGYVRILSMLNLIYSYEGNPNKDLKKALNYGLKAIRLQPSNEVMLLSCAKIYYNTNDFLNAEKYFKSAYEINPNGYDQNFFLGLIYSAQRNFIKGKKYLENAIRINPNDWSAYGDLGYILIWPPYKDYELALQNANKAIELNPNDYYGYYIAAVIYKAMANRTEAEKYLELAKQRNQLIEKVSYKDLEAN